MRILAIILVVWVILALKFWETPKALENYKKLQERAESKWAPIIYAVAVTILCPVYFISRLIRETIRI
jgi:hypothetical protein